MVRHRQYLLHATPSRWHHWRPDDFGTSDDNGWENPGYKPNGRSRNNLEGFDPVHSFRFRTSGVRRPNRPPAQPAPNRLLERLSRCGAERDPWQFGHPELQSFGSSGAEDFTGYNHGVLHNDFCKQRNNAPDQDDS